MNTSLLLQQCPACLAHLIWMVLEMGGWWLYSHCFVGCYFQELFNNAHNSLVQFPSNFFSKHLVSIRGVHPYNRIDTTTAWKSSNFIQSDRANFYMIDNQLTVHHVFVIVVGNEHGDTSSNPGRDWLHFT